MKRSILLLCLGIVLFCSLSISSIFDIPAVSIAEKFSVPTQEPVGIKFVSPLESESLSGNVTIKVNASVIQDADVIVHWDSDSWIDISDDYNLTSHLYEYTIDVTCFPSGNMTFEAKQVTTHGTVETSVVARIDWYRPPILIVDDSSSSVSEDYYTTALEALGYNLNTGYHIWSTSMNGSPTADDLFDYQFVIWYTGGAAYALSSEERNTIEEYLSNISTPKFLLTGTDNAWTGYNAGNYEVWLSVNFGVNDFVGEGSDTESLIGGLWGPYVGANYSYGGGDGSQIGGSPDWVRTLEASMGLIEYESSDYDEYAATMSPFVNGLFFGFAFDAISFAEDRIDIMNRTISYMDIYAPPQVEFVSPISAEILDSPISFEWESSSSIFSLYYDPTYNIYVDGGPILSDIILETSLLSLSDGPHTVRIVCEDNYGQRGYDFVSFEVDSSEPAVSVLTPEVGSVLMSGCTLEFEISDLHLQDATACWDSAIMSTFPVPYSTSLPSGDGAHTFHVNATDVAGNWNYSEFVFICDDTKPSISLASLNNGTCLKSGSVIELLITDAHMNYTLYHWDLDSDSDFSVNYEVLLPSGEGIHDLYVTATDIPGNQKSAHYQFMTDDISPSIYLGGLSNGTIMRTAESLSLEIGDLHFEAATCRWDLFPFIEYTTPSLLLYAPPIEGEHWLSVNASDAAGNWKTTKLRIIVDNTAPEIFLIFPDDGDTVSGGTQIEVGITDLHLKSVQYRWDAGMWSEWNAPYVLIAPTDGGYHSLFVNTTDDAGNRLQTVFVFNVNEEAISSITTTTTTLSNAIALSLATLLIGCGLGCIITLVAVTILVRRKIVTL